MVSGCNVESTTVGIKICAERTALVKAVSEGMRKFKAVAIVAQRAQFCWPCGICRQFLFEFSPDMDVVVEDEASAIVVHKLKDLLPQLI